VIGCENTCASNRIGIIIVIAAKIGLLTPPLGTSVLTEKSTLNDSNISVESIFAGTLPYVGVTLAVLLLIIIFRS
jgi:C4-dicarboxylate transporter DctM subunit